LQEQLLSGGIKVVSKGSAVKRQKQSESRRLRNKMMKSRIKTSAKKIHEAIAGKNKEEAIKNVNEFNSLVDSAVTKGIYHKNNAARKKSRIDRMVKSL
jgi:small subunit ribosomal protein S20